MLEKRFVIYHYLFQVVIRGPKEEVEKAKRTLLDMSNEKNLSGYTETIRSKPEHHRYCTFEFPKRQ